MLGVCPVCQQSGIPVRSFAGVYLMEYHSFYGAVCDGVSQEAQAVYRDASVQLCAPYSFSSDFAASLRRYSIGRLIGAGAEGRPCLTADQIAMAHKLYQRGHTLGFIADYLRISDVAARRALETECDCDYDHKDHS